MSQQQLERPNPFDTYDRDQDDFVSTDDWEDFDGEGYADEPYGEEYGTDDPWGDDDLGLPN
jgi:hypothetical protein